MAQVLKLKTGMAENAAMGPFPRYLDWDPKIPVWCATPGQGRCIHRFFDTCPISPSGRYLAAFRLGAEDRLNEPGETGQVVLVDLHTGGERVVAETRGWELQMGANLNWGKDDHTLLFNDVDAQAWRPFLRKVDPLRGIQERLEGGVYHVSTDGRHAAAASLEKMARTQYGYGVRLPEERVARNVGARSDDGLFITDLETGKRRLVFSLEQAVPFIDELKHGNPEEWEIYGFHSKWSPAGDRLIFTIRRFKKDGPMRMDLISSEDPGQQLRYDVLTLRPDGTDVHNAVPADRWEKGGHHVNWYPDGSALSMNLRLVDGENLCLVRVDPDGNNLRLMAENLPGSGHPTVHRDGRHVLTDTYELENAAYGDGTVPLRWLDLQNGTEEKLVRTGARTAPKPVPLLRVDPHPAWGRDWRRVVFNGVAKGEKTRRVFLADFSPLLGS